MNLNIEQLENLVNENHKINTSYRSYNENENFSFDGKDLFSVLDFWHYQYSNIGAFGGALAEFFVARALGIDKAENVNYWTAYDMSYKGKRIEVKSTQYVHPWNKTKISNQRSFSIEPTKNSYWTNKTNSLPLYSRQNDLYVFCLNINKDISKNDPLCLNNWVFYVVPTYKINNYANERQKTISLNVVKKLANKECTFIELKAEIENTIETINNEQRT